MDGFREIAYISIISPSCTGAKFPPLYASGLTFPAGTPLVLEEFNEKLLRFMASLKEKGY